jgi:hypothetical protein
MVKYVELPLSKSKSVEDLLGRQAANQLEMLFVEINSYLPNLPTSDLVLRLFFFSTAIEMEGER